MRMTSEKFDSNEYWRKRHEKFQDNSQGVGNVSFSQQENDQIYEKSRQRVCRILDIIGHPRNVLDLGCGLGLMAEPFVERNIDYTGIDISESALASASRKYPNSRFICCDVATLDLNEKFDFVMERTVFIHLVDEEKWLAALTVARNHLEQDGIFLLHDKIPANTEQPAPHVIFRSEAQYQSAFEQIKMRFDDDLHSRIAAVCPTDNIRFVRLQ